MERLMLMILFFQGACFPQAICQIEEASEKSKTSVPYRTKIAEFSYSTLYNYYTQSNSSEFGNANSEIDRDNLLRIRLGIPMVIKDAALFGVHLKYDRHNFALSVNNTAAYDLYQHIEASTFTSLGARFLFQKSLDDTREISIVVGAEVNSDELKLATNTTKYYGHFAYKKKINTRTKVGGALLVGYFFGRPQVYPLFSLERKLNPKWTIDLNLPKQAALRYKVNDKFYMSVIAEVKGWCYGFSNSNLAIDQPLILSKSDLNLGVSLEHEIHDWLWIGLDAGFSKNMRYFMAKPGDRYKDALIHLTTNDSPYLKVGLFIVPPKKLFK